MMHEFSLQVHSCEAGRGRRRLCVQAEAAVLHISACAPLLRQNDCARWYDWLATCRSTGDSTASASKPSRSSTDVSPTPAHTTSAVASQEHVEHVSATGTAASTASSPAGAATAWHADKPMQTASFSSEDIEAAATMKRLMQPHSQAQSPAKSWRIASGGRHQF